MMETLGSIVDFVGVLLVIVAVILFLVSMCGEVVTMVVSPLLMIAGVSLMGLGDMCHVDDEKLRDFARDCMKKQDGSLIIAEYRDELDTFYLSLTDIDRNRSKIQNIIISLRNKSNMVSNEQAKQIFNRKIEQLKKQRARLDRAQEKLELYAYEQLLVNFAKTLEYEGISSDMDFARDVQRELETVKAVMDEVASISNL